MIIDLKKEQMSISEALFIAKPHDTIILDDIIYYETIVVDKPFIKMVLINLVHTILNSALSIV